MEYLAQNYSMNAGGEVMTLCFLCGRQILCLATLMTRRIKFRERWCGVLKAGDHDDEGQTHETERFFVRCLLSKLVFGRLPQ
jgi:hypothetical protein